MELYRGAPYEYSAAFGGLVFTAGACPLDADGRVVAPGDRETQAARCVDNLLAAAKIKPFLVVMPFGYGVQPGTSGGGDSNALFSRDLIEDVIPYIQSHYRAETARELAYRETLKGEAECTSAGCAGSRSPTSIPRVAPPV